MLDQLDHSAITAHYQGEERGGPPYHLGTIVKVMVCGCRTGVGCSRRIAKRLHENIPFRVLAANNTPDFRNISDFRKDHLKALADLFQQSYNYQAVVDSECQVIVAARATNVASDKQQAADKVEETLPNTGAMPRELSADAGYYSARAVEGLCALGVDPLIAPERTRHGARPEPVPRGRIPQGTVGQGPDAAEAAGETEARTLRAADDGGAGVRCQWR